jgi:hypothetical protein
MIKITLSKSELIAKEYLIWNAFIDIVALEDEANLTLLQKIAKRAFVYDSEVQNGGHQQYFENLRLTNYSEIVKSLMSMNAPTQADILQRAATLFQSKERPPIEGKFQYSEIALEGEFDKLDREYYEASPTLTELMKDYLIKNINEFIRFTD